MLNTAVMQKIRTYIDRRQSMVAQWVALRTIFEVSTQEETGYAGGGRRRATWWRQTAEDTQFRDTLKEILLENRERR